MKEIIPSAEEKAALAQAQAEADTARRALRKEQMIPDDRPIRPDEVAIAKKSVFPKEVFQAFNEMIVSNAVGGYSKFKAKDVASLIAKKLRIRLGAVYDKNYLNVEDTYRKEGWKVIYDKPGFNETYDPTFTFRRE